MSTSNLVKRSGWVLAAVFAAVGGLFLLAPGAPIMFFNRFSAAFGLPAAPVPEFQFYLVLAVAYMYVVTVLAVLMARHPEDLRLPLLLAQAKLFSSGLSLAVFLVHRRWLILAANAVTDGTIGAYALWLRRRIRRDAERSRP